MSEGLQFNPLAFLYLRREGFLILYIVQRTPIFNVSATISDIVFKETAHIIIGDGVLVSLKGKGLI